MTWSNRLPCRRRCTRPLKALWPPIMSRHRSSSASAIAPIHRHWRGAARRVATMNEPKDFLTRWSRRKRAAADSAQPGAQRAEAEATQAAAATGERPPADPLPASEPGPGAREALVDLSKLPSLDSISAATDIRPFLAPGVPVELTRAALRRAWTMDPSIRDFVGLAENQWDFTAPGGVPGLGTLADTEQIRRLVAKVIGDAEPQPATAAPAEPHAIASAKTAAASINESADPEGTEEAPKTVAMESSHVLQCSSDADPSGEVNDEKVNRQRRHGSALPQCQRLRPIARDYMVIDRF